MARDYLEIYRRAAASSMDRVQTDKVNGTQPTMTTPADDGAHLIFVVPSA
jgi:hypothetical protein